MTQARTAKGVDHPALVERLDGVKLPSKYFYDHSDQTWWDFAGWKEKAVEPADPDMARLLLYFGLQPLFDALVDGLVSDGERPDAIKALDILINEGSKYLASYYLGSPDLDSMVEAFSEAGELMPNEAVYRTKFRNVDYNGISVADIHTYLQKFAQLIEAGETPKPEAVVCVACGGSEVSMALAGVLDVQHIMIRMSHRRGDSKPKLVKEQSRVIKKTVKDRHVVCIEDYVVTARSLSKVIDKVTELGAGSTIGSSINAADPSYVNPVYSSRKFHLLQ